MEQAKSVDAIANGFPYPTLHNQPGKPSYVPIKDTHRLLTANVASIKSPCVWGQNSHLRLVLTTTQYPLVSQVPFVRLTNPGHTSNILVWINPFDKKALLRKHAKQR